jgi:biotin carboxyl carrier protein
LVEAMRQAYNDRNNVLGDPAFTHNPVDELLSSAHAASIRAHTPPRRAAQSGHPLREGPAMGEKASSRGARRSKRRGLRSQINLDYTDIRSPIAGEVSRTSVTEGNVVSPNSDVLTKIVSQDPMRSARGVARAASQIDLQLLKLGDALIDAPLP